MRRFRKYRKPNYSRTTKLILIAVLVLLTAVLGYIIMLEARQIKLERASCGEAWRMPCTLRQKGVRCGQHPRRRGHGDRCGGGRRNGVRRRLAVHGGRDTRLLRAEITEEGNICG